MTGKTDTAMSATEIKSKIHEPPNYDEAISDPVHGRQWKKAIEEKLHNLEQHNTWKYDEVPSGLVAIGSK